MAVGPPARSEIHPPGILDLPAYQHGRVAGDRRGSHHLGDVLVADCRYVP
jgi:hypothetical protein